MDTNTRGRISELIAFRRFVELGYTVLEPINKDGVYDCVVEKEGVFKRVQIKTARIIEETIIIPMKSTSHNRVGNSTKSYSKDEVDWICGVSPELNRMWIVPAGIRKSELRVSISSDEFQI